jgi:F-type H+-transporting ATPase subunit epsilon
VDSVSPLTKPTLQVDIADIGALFYSGICFSIVAPAALGEVCILPRHAPFLSKLIPGEIRLQTVQDESLSYYVSGGYLEVKNSTVTVLADHMLRSNDIDREAALAAKADAEHTLKTSPFDNERDAAKLEWAKAIAQLKVLEHLDSAQLRKHRR